MKTEKNNIYFKKIYFLFLKLALWGIFCWVFVNFSFLIPLSSDNLIHELIVFLILAITINIHTFYLYPKIAKKNNTIYVFLLIGSVLMCSLFELFVFSKIFDPSYYTFLNRNKILLITFGSVSIRNLTFFIFFLWIEYSYHLVQLLKKKDDIYQKEISFLIEKQEFEKNYSRKKLLPHYFFNILELINIDTSINKNNNELLNKIKFILYYFLVDAEQEIVELDKELAFYKYYIELENFRHKEKITVNFTVLGQIDDFFILPLLFEPLIGNAMKYTKRDGAGYVNVTIDATNFPVLIFCCSNNYSSYDLISFSSESGLKIMEQRLELCYKNNYTLKTYQNDDFYEVVLSISLK